MYGESAHSERSKSVGRRAEAFDWRRAISACSSGSVAGCLFARLEKETARLFGRTPAGGGLLLTGLVRE